MKPDKVKKEKSPSFRPPTATTKRPLLKKASQPDIMISTRPITAGTMHSKGISGVTTATHSAKSPLLQHPNPLTTAISSHNSPKASLVESKNTKQYKKTMARKEPVRKKDPSKNDVSQKSKEQIKKSLANVIKVYYPSKQCCLDVSITEATKDTTQKESLKDTQLSRSDFRFIQVVGQGGYGKVWKVEMLKNKKLFAMKEMNKALVVQKKSVDNVLNQLKVLQSLRSPFLANVVSAFNDRDHLYLIMDLLPGADLRCRMAYHHKFTQEQARFLIACIVTALEYVHKKKIFHRDIKPENLVFDEIGYLRLTDFGIARAEHSKQSLDASGTPGYMAPEVLCKQIHSYPVDWYAVGIIAHELMLGKRPYHGNNRIQIRDAVISKQHLVRKSEVPPGWSVDGADLINKLIQRNPANRWGSRGGVKELKSHPWFNKFKWGDLQSKKMKSPFGEYLQVPEASENQSFQQEALMQFKLLQRAEGKTDVLAQYYFQSIHK